MKLNQRLGDFTKNGIWPPSKGPWDDMLLVGVICAATVVLVPCIVGMKIQSLVTKPRTK
jgi:hypothetical protein